MASTLVESTGLDNVHVLPNFRSYDRGMPVDHPSARVPLRLVYCARVFKEKGIEEAIAAVDRLNAETGGPAALLHVYGPVEASYRTRFTERLGASSSAIYKGVLEAADLYGALRDYDLLLFPTYYYGEGFAGTILDSFIAGVPVLASDWAYNRELVAPGCTGDIVKARSVEELTGALRRYALHPQLLDAMRPICRERALDYHVDHALAGLFSDLGVATK
jgi:glycosyltransferase involved in cell wall biosynthesis